MKVGLRIDVDTLRGTREGLPALCKLLHEQGILGTLYLSLGPDNMGRNLWRLLNPAFLRKMLRSNAPGLYGWDILLSGTFGPGPQLGKRCAQQIREAAQAGHEIGFHAWDHYHWQRRVARMSRPEIREEIQRGVRMIESITGAPPVTSACPGWRCTNDVLTVKSEFPFRYNSDCRGDSVFLPQVNGQLLTQPQIPVNLPTYDEVIGNNGITDSNYNEHLCSLLNPETLQVLTIHTEVEGLSRIDLFRRFLKQAKSLGVDFVPLGELLTEPCKLPSGWIEQNEIPGREGWVACQVNTERISL